MVNPIERRLEQLYEHWDTFVEHESARLLRWVVSPGDLRAVEAFFAAEDDERAGQLSVGFLRFEDEFGDPLAYAATLHTRLLEAIEMAAALIDPEDPSPPIASFVAPLSIGDALHDLMATAEALSFHYGEGLPMLALVLMPKAIDEAAAWVAWLRTALARVPARVRVVVFDWHGADALCSLAQAEPERVHTEVIALDLPSAAVEISSEAGGLEQPHGQFRHAYVQMIAALGQRDIAGAEQHAIPALALAQAQGWGHLEVAVAFGLGSGLLGVGQPQRALALFGQAERRALLGEQAGEAWGIGLRLKSRLGMGAAAVLAEAWPQAAQLYFDTVPVAQEAADPRSELDCLRMASYCRQNHGELHEAWALGLAALELGEAMLPEQRETSTLGFAGVALEQLADKVSGDWASVERRMVAALGREWRPAT